MAVIARDPAHASAVYILVRLNRSILTLEEQKQFFAKAQEQLPDYLPMYKSYLNSLSPKWGGSDKELLLFARLKAHNSPESILVSLIQSAHNMIGSAQAYRRADLGNGEHDDATFEKYYKKYFLQSRVMEDFTMLLEPALEHNPQFTRGLFNYAHLMWRIDQKDKALQYYKKAIDSDIYFMGPYYINLYAREMQRAGRTDEAKKYFEMYLGAFRDDEDMDRKAEAADHVAYYYAVQGAYKKSEPYYKMVMDLRPESAKAISNYCNALFNVYRYDEAIRTCNRAIEVDSDHAWSYHILAETYGRMGDTQNRQKYQQKYDGFRQ